MNLLKSSINPVISSLSSVRVPNFARLMIRTIWVNTWCTCSYIYTRSDQVSTTSNLIESYESRDLALFLTTSKVVKAELTFPVCFLICSHSR